MNAKLLIPVIAGSLFTLSAQAQDCSGGTGGGMDATGNQCNEAVYAADNSYAPTPKAGANKAQSSKKSAPKRSAATRQTATRSQTKQG